MSDLQPQLFEHSFIGDVLFGVNAVERVGERAASIVEGRNSLIVTERGIVEAGLTERIQVSLEAAGFYVAVCDKAVPEPTMVAYQDVLDVANEQKPDLLVGVGGGSSMDVAKTVARALTNPRPLEEYLGKEFEEEGVPLITIPTTSGTGAEVTPDAVILLPERKVKSVFLNARAALAIVDPTMTLTLPPRITAATGVDALSHAIESALSKIASPLTQALALESIRLVSENLRIATFEGSNLEARTNMAWATLIEGLSESNAGDVEAHAVGHLIGAYYRIHHGVACGIGLPYCMMYNLPVNTSILARIAQAMNPSITGTPREMAEQGIGAVYELIEEIGCPTSISDIEGACEEHIPELARLYCTEPDIVEILELFAKRGVPTEDEAVAFFEEIWEGF